MLDLQTAYISRVGGRSRNEDACGYWTSDEGCCWVVSDGAGGHGNGDRAAQIVVSTVLEGFSRLPAVGEAEAIALLESAQTAVMAEKTASQDGNDMHATAAILLIDAKRQQAVWSHVGDTRIYHFRNHTLLHQTRDHSLVQNMIDGGYYHTDICRSHPLRNLLTSSIGNADDLAPSVSGTPITIAPGDTFLICSDGWWEYIDEQQMAAELAAAANSTEWLERMAEIIEAANNQHSDNFTAISLQVRRPIDEITVVLP